jgi:hypothetical protein
VHVHMIQGIKCHEAVTGLSPSYICWLLEDHRAQSHMGPLLSRASVSRSPSPWGVLTHLPGAQQGTESSDQPHREGRVSPGPGKLGTGAEG